MPVGWLLKGFNHAAILGGTELGRTGPQFADAKQIIQQRCAPRAGGGTDGENELGKMVHAMRPQERFQGEIHGFLVAGVDQLAGVLTVAGDINHLAAIEREHGQSGFPA